MDYFEAGFSDAVGDVNCTKTWNLLTCWSTDDVVWSYQWIVFINEKPAAVHSGPQFVMDLCRWLADDVINETVGSNATLIVKVMCVAVDRQPLIAATEYWNTSTTECRDSEHSTSEYDIQAHGTNNGYKGKT